MSTKQQIDSYYETLKKLAPKQAEVIAILIEHPEGLGAWEIAEKMQSYVHAVRPRITELVGLGLLTQKGERQCPESGRNEAVWIYQPSNQMRLF